MYPASNPFTRLISSSAGESLTIGSNTLEVSFPVISQDSRNDEGGGRGRRGPIVNTENQHYLAFAILCALDGTGAHDACVIRLTGCALSLSQSLFRAVHGVFWRLGLGDVSQRAFRSVLL